MIAQLEGVLVEKAPMRVVVNVGGIGYDVLVPVTTYKRLEEVGKPVKLLTYLHVREDVMQLFGFVSRKEKWIFMNLISVSGVGPKLALSILSGAEAEDLKRMLITENLAGLTRLPGVGKKTAQRLVIELKEKMAKASLETEESLDAGPISESEASFEEAVLALMSLGHTRTVAEKVVSAVIKAEQDLPLDEIVRRALQSM